jgi:triacylglycerol lipase
VKTVQRTLFIFAVAFAVAAIAQAQVPPELAKQIAAIGRGVCPAETAQIYRPLHGNPPYPGVSFARDISFGPDPKNVLDVASPETGAGSRPVLIYVSGGPGNKQQGGPNGGPFYDNVMVWAVKNGMVGVNMQRRPGKAWDDPAKDVSLVVQWVNQNIARYKGNPARVFIWSQSAGNVPVSTYVGHPEYYGPQGVGVKGVVFMSAANFNILPATPPKTEDNPPCGQPTSGTPAPPSAAPAPAAAAGKAAEA